MTKTTIEYGEKIAKKLHHILILHIAAFNED